MRPYYALTLAFMATIACAGTGTDETRTDDVPGRSDLADAQEDAAKDTSVSGNGASVTQEVGSEGGTLAVEGATLTIPAGALAGPTTLTMTQDTAPTPGGYEAYSPLYRFEPEGLTFAKPVVVSIPMTVPGADQRAATLFWSRQGATGYERLSASVSGGIVTANVTHFSRGFAANGIDYIDPPDRSCARTTAIAKRNVGTTAEQGSSALALFFTADDCQGRPLTNLACADYPSSCDFLIQEDGNPLSVEAGATILQKSGLQVFVSLVLDMSSSTKANLPEIIDGAKAFINKLLVERKLPVQISLQLFAGEKNLTEWQQATMDAGKLVERLDALRSFTPADIASTNLNGAIVAALQRQDATKKDFEQRNAGGAFTTGYLVLFTDGADTAGLVTPGQVTDAKSTSRDLVAAVALATPDFNASALASLVDIPVLVSPDPLSLYRDFSDLANRIAGQTARIYELGYCSPKRTGPHQVSVTVTGAKAEAVPVTATFDFNASGFGPGCTRDLFLNLCKGMECGGIACGACDDRISACDPTSNQCVNFCKSMNRCGGQVITNPRGYQQDCNNVPESTLCDGACVDTTLDPNHCGGCGTRCRDLAFGANCVDSSCACPDRLTPCAGECVDLMDNSHHCGKCGQALLPGERCIDGVPTCIGSPGRICDGECRDLSQDPLHCGECGRAIPAGGSCVKGVPSCPSGKTDCLGTCVSLDTNPHHCGSCNRICQDSCSAGRCQQRLWCSPHQAWLGALATDDSFLYFTVETVNLGIFRLPLMGGDATQIVASESAYRIGNLVIDQDNIYWIDGQGLFSAPKDGSGPVTALDPRAAPGGSEGPVKLAADETSLYYIAIFQTNDETAPRYEIRKIAKSGGATTRVAGPFWTFQVFGDTLMAVDDSYLYFFAQPRESEPFKLLKAPKAGGAMVTLWSAKNIFVQDLRYLDLSIGTTAADVFFLAPQGYSASDLSKNLYRLPKSSSTPVVLVNEATPRGGDYEELHFSRPLLVDSNHLYWSLQGNVEGITRSNHDGTMQQKVVGNLISGDSESGRIFIRNYAIDDTSLYWIQAGAQCIWRTEK